MSLEGSGVPRAAVPPREGPAALGGQRVWGSAGTWASPLPGGPCSPPGPSRLCLRAPLHKPQGYHQLLSRTLDLQATRDPADPPKDLRLEAPAQPFRTLSRSPQGKSVQQSTLTSRASPLPTLSQGPQGWTEGQKALLERLA